ncbi:MAG: hypothetical protein WCG81_03510, partial [Candidatus Angelobacter sp.]
MKKVLIPLFVIALMIYIAPSAHADNWTYLGQAHVDGQHDHDNIEIGKAAGRYRFLQIRIKNAPIEFDRIVVHYGNGEPEVLQVREVIRRGGHSRPIALQGDRFVKSFELWYGKASSKLFTKRSPCRAIGRLWPPRRITSRTCKT